jgi:hypothetical protein
MPGIGEHCRLDAFGQIGERDPGITKLSEDLVRNFVGDGVNGTSLGESLIGTLAESSPSVLKALKLPFFRDVPSEVISVSRECAATILRGECPMFEASETGEITFRQVEVQVLKI